jgi:hypothetical protein
MFMNCVKTFGLYSAACVLLIGGAGILFANLGNTTVAPRVNAPKEPECGKLLSARLVPLPAGPENPPKKSQNGLKLTLSVKQTNIQARDAVAVDLTFTNVSDKPIKLDTHHMIFQMPYTGPNVEGSMGHRAIVDVAPTEAHYPLLAPGKSWTRHFKEGKGLSGLSTCFTVPGQYRLKVTYRHSTEIPYPPAKGSWTGTLESNELIVTVE